MGDIHVERLWDLSQQRVDELGKELQGIADDAGVSTQTLYKWRKGQRVKGSNDRAIHRAFRWELGSREAILDGGDPTPLAAEVAHPEHAPPAPTPTDVDAEMEEAVERFRKLPLNKRMEAFRELFEELHQAIDARSEGDERQRPAG